MSEKEILAQNLKHHRQSKGFTQEELGQKVGLTKDTISKLELAKQDNIGFKYLVLMCQELDISIEELFIEDSKHVPFKLVISDENFETMKALLKNISYALSKISEKEVKE